MGAITWNEQQRQAVREILITDWAKLSEGDLSIILLALQTREEPTSVVVMDGTAHAKFWRHMVTLKWAEEVNLDPEILEIGASLHVFQLNEFGRITLPEFIRNYDLMSVGENARSYGRANGLANYYEERAKEWQASNLSLAKIIVSRVKKYPFTFGVVPLFLILKMWQLI
jgi:hypothetical protein